jgi:hypothetical protein
MGAKVSDIEYNKGFEAGKNFARNEVLDFIEQHLQEEVLITVEDVATEIEYMQRREIREKNG